MFASYKIVFLCISFLFAFCFASILFYYLFSAFFIRKKQSNIKFHLGINDSSDLTYFVSDGLSKKILISLLNNSYRSQNNFVSNVFIHKLLKFGSSSKKLKKLFLETNMPKIINSESFRETQIKYSILLGISGGLLGCIFSNLLLFLLLFAGMVVGFYLPYWALKKEKQSRLDSLEKNLPEMLDVVALSMRSGLTFDRAVDIYCSYFDNDLSKNFYDAKIKWDNSVSSREEALRHLSITYDSYLLKRLVENIIRSLRFGTSLVENLEQTAQEARDLYKEKQEEIVSKAPVKMMFPTGTLILPAMLIFVLGPVILELISGF